jgi:hypothetical protein
MPVPGNPINKAMRAFEFLTESSLVVNEGKTMAQAELKKGNGKYIKTIIDAIENSRSLNFVNKAGAVSGTVKNSNAVVAELNAILANAQGQGNLVFSRDPSKILLQVETEDGDNIETSISKIIKDELSKGEFTFNLGNVAEAIMGSAMTAKFEKQGKTISLQDAKSVGQRLFDAGETLESRAGKDQLTFKMSLPSRDARAFFAFLGKGEQTLQDLEVGPEKIKELEKMFNDAVSYVNESPRAKAAIDKAAADPAENRVDVLSDGGNPEKQNITKVDLEIIFDGRKINLISLKAGSVKQIGQESGAEFETLERFFKSTIGFGLPNSMKENFRPKEDPNYKEYNYTYAFPKAYDHIYNELKSHVSGDNSRKEYSLVQSVYNGIHYHGTRGEEGVILVVLSPGAKQAYQELTLGKSLLEELQNYDLDVIKKTDGKNYIIEVYGIAKTAEARKLDAKARLVQFRSYKQENAVRNAVEIGPLLKDLADLQKMDKRRSAQPPAPQPAQPQDELNSLKKNAGMPAQPQPPVQPNVTGV